ncbi:hypothetical protein GW7_08767 [Heterocephalus glaber]|uniref:Uncharacterized protein n=1 Tax=Heterocephalus glaber TaxID=10181 RepID=G5BBJ8_HETGA|nr:hypothetical protein GW7_08767 [Heterocephalus glaber]
MAQDFQDLRDLKHLILDNVLSLFEAGPCRAVLCCPLLSSARRVAARAGRGGVGGRSRSSAPLHGLPETLPRLGLKGNAVRDVAEQELRGLKQLQVLNLRNSEISALELRALAGLQRLLHLCLDGHPWHCACALLRGTLSKCEGTLDTGLNVSTQDIWCGSPGMLERGNMQDYTLHTFCDDCGRRWSGQARSMAWDWAKA